MNRELDSLGDASGVGATAISVRSDDAAAVGHPQRNGGWGLVGVGACIAIAAAVTLNLSQVLIATHGDPIGVRVVIGVFVAASGALLFASSRLSAPAFALAAGLTLMVLILAGFITLSAGTT